MKQWEHEVDLEAYDFRSKGFRHEVIVCPGEWTPDGWVIFISSGMKDVAASLTKEEAIDLANMILERNKDEH